MRWNLRLAAANRGIWKASELRRLLAERGLEISVGKMSGLWSGQPNVLRPDELDAFCAVLGCGIEELITVEPDKVPAPAGSDEPVTRAAGAGSDAGSGAGSGGVRRITPKPRSGRSLPPR
ncbi:helix-turn-helix transcriptional regulator [Pseudonocardia xishanensis]|uniref:HTH cro/C1-type domain-containing protein n=1 Tax=Pseudonocardia xishanensis TaxID=630995 RepID=A0ABP8S3Z6_9PSEU